MDWFVKSLEETYKLDKQVESSTEKDKRFMCQSLQSWNARHNGVPFLDRGQLKYNQILFIDFGFSYSPELAFSHPCLLLSYNNRLCSVLPITSSNRIVTNAYHPSINPAGNKAHYLLPVGTSLLSKPSAVYVKQFRTISESRIIKFIDKNGLPMDLYKDIRNSAFTNSFPDKQYALEKCQEELTKQKELVSQLTQEINTLKSTLTKQE